MRPRLAVFDVDGTLVDSQIHIHSAMTATFDELGRTAPDLSDVRQVVGLSLPVAIARLAPELDDRELDRAVEAYKSSFSAMRGARGAELSPLYDGIAAVLAELAEEESLILGVATGKSRRGLDHILDLHGLRGMFFTLQVADDHPSKPHPSMLLRAAEEAGCELSDAVMIGDTVFDLQMANAARMPAIGVGWGYHEPDTLLAETPRHLAQTTRELPGLIRETLDF